MVDLFKENIPFVHYWARRYNVGNVDYDDLVQEGMIGLTEAVSKYKPEKGKFIDYAFPWIRGHMLDALEASTTIKLPSYVYKDIQRIRKAKSRLMQELERDPVLNEIAEHLGMTLHKVAELESFPASVRSMDQLLEDESPLSYFMSDTEEQPSGFNDVLNFRLDEMPVRHRVVVNMRYGLNGRPQRSLKECGNILGISYEWVRHLENEALSYLKALKDK